MNLEHLSWLKSLLLYARGSLMKIIYSGYYIVCRLSYGKKKRKSNPSNLNHLRNYGYFPITSKRIQQVSATISRYFKFNRNECYGLAENNGKFHIEKATDGQAYPYLYLPKSEVFKLNLAEEFFHSDLYLQLCDYYGCNLKLINTAVWLTEANAYYEGGSFIWHRDSMPKPYIKLLFYLNDITSIEEGAFRLIPVTNKEIHYIPSYHKLREPGIPPDYEFAYTLKGSAGSGIVFDPNCLHYAGRSISSDSLICSFHLIPHHNSGLKFYQKFRCGVAPCQENSLLPFMKWWEI